MALDLDITPKPPSSGSGGSANVETCTVEVTQTYYTINYTTVDENNKLEYISEEPESLGSIHSRIITCACNTMIGAKLGPVQWPYTLVGVELLFNQIVNSNRYCLFKITASAGEEASIIFGALDS